MSIKLIDEFEKWFSTKPKFLIQTPGRVNLIGEHTDYNNGFVLPIAIDRHIGLAFNPRSDHLVNIYSMDYQKLASFCLRDLTNKNTEQKEWYDYAKGVAWALQEKHSRLLTGFDAVLHGNIPKGAGLSSSAALELTIAKAFVTTSHLSDNDTELAQLCQRAENKWVGVNCGIMDQMIVALGQTNRALLIDCRDLQTKLIPMPKGVSIIIMDTMKRRGLVDSEYNSRRQQCETAAKILEAKSLRDVNIEKWQKDKNKLSGDLLKRAQHVITENQRVLDAVDAMHSNDSIKLGELMNASHESLRNDFEVSCSELDTMVNIAKVAAGCLGARMTGAGFGGCAIALVKEEYADDFVIQVAEQYEAATGIKPELYVTQAVDGVKLVNYKL
jgi:galactokinase